MLIYLNCAGKKMYNCFNMCSFFFSAQWEWINRAARNAFYVIISFDPFTVKGAFWEWASSFCCGSLRYLVSNPRHPNERQTTHLFSIQITFLCMATIYIKQQIYLFDPFVFQAQELTGVAVPKYYNPAAVNPLKYAEQVQKRKLLWGKKEKDKPVEVSDWDGLLINTYWRLISTRLRYRHCYHNGNTAVINMVHWHLF